MTSTLAPALAAFVNLPLVAGQEVDVPTVEPGVSPADVKTFGDAGLRQTPNTTHQFGRRICARAQTFETSGLRKREGCEHALAQPKPYPGPTATRAHKPSISTCAYNAIP